MKLNKNQILSNKKLSKFKVGALFMYMGTGKTLAAYNLVKSTNVDAVLWITPFATKTSLLAEINKCGGLDNLHIVGVETLQNSDKTYLQLVELVSTQNVFMIVDESLKIKNFEAKRTKRVLRLGNKCEYKLILNGTPISRNILDLWSQFEFLSPKILNCNFTEFKYRFCEIVKISKKRYITDFHNIDYLYSQIGKYVYECSLELDINKTHKVLNYYLSDSETEKYGEIKSRMLSFGNMQDVNNNIFLQLTQKLQHSYCLASDKLFVLKKLLATLDTSKVLIYTKYIDSYDKLKELYPHITVLTYGKHSYGLNLQAYNTTIYFDKTFDYAQILQSEFRTYRIGQKEDCAYYYLTGANPLDELIDRNIDRKTNLSEYLKSVGINEFSKEL
jgi:hypothetical protein